MIKRWLAGQVVTEAKIQEVMSVRTYPFLATDTPITYSTQKLVNFIKRHNVLPLPLGLIWFQSDQPNKAKEILSMHVPSVPFNEEGWRYILKEHNGHLPIKIKAIPEGTVLPTKNILFSVENTDPKCYWLVGYLETLLVQVRNFFRAIVLLWTIRLGTRALLRLSHTRWKNESNENLTRLPIVTPELIFRFDLSLDQNIYILLASWLWIPWGQLGRVSRYRWLCTFGQFQGNWYNAGTVYYSLITVVLDSYFGTKPFERPFSLRVIIITPSALVSQCPHPNTQLLPSGNVMARLMLIEIWWRNLKMELFQLYPIVMIFITLAAIFGARNWKVQYIYYLT